MYGSVSVTQHVSRNDIADEDRCRGKQHLVIIFYIGSPDRQSQRNDPAHHEWPELDDLPGDKCPQSIKHDKKRENDLVPSITCKDHAENEIGQPHS